MSLMSLTVGGVCVSFSLSSHLPGWPWPGGVFL